MSMYEIENLVEQSIRLIDTSVKAAEEKRNLIWNLYELQKKFDCGFTHLRVFDILRKYDFVQMYAPEDFPGYKTFPSETQEAMKNDFSFLFFNPQKGESKSNPPVAYWIRKEEKIFVDFGSIYFTAGGGPTIISVNSLARQMVQEAHTQYNKLLVYLWSAFILHYGRKLFPGYISMQDLKQDYLNYIRNIFHKYNFSDMGELYELLVLKADEKWYDSLKDRLNTEDTDLIKWFLSNS